MKNDLERASLLYLGKLLSNDSFYTEELEDAYISLKDAIETKQKLEKENQYLKEKLELSETNYDIIYDYFSQLGELLNEDTCEGILEKINILIKKIRI